MTKYYCNYCNFRTIRKNRLDDHLINNHLMTNKNIILTLSTCFYKIKSKFNLKTYEKWIKNFLDNVNNFYLVIYTDENSKNIFDKYKNNKKIKIIIKEFKDFYNYKYKDYWIKNQKKNKLLDYIDWKLQLIWAEKISFVKNTIDLNYFNTEYHGWCDIGYFRCKNSITYAQIKLWPNNEKIKKLNTKKIYYCDVSSEKYKQILKNIIMNKNNLGLPINPIPADQISIAGGFFITHKNNIDWWFNTFYNKLELYFFNDYLVKDDQIIIIDCIINNFEYFKLIKEQNNNYNEWFAFSTYLL